VTQTHWTPADLVPLLREKAAIETADNGICITQHLDHMAAAEIERLRENISRLLTLISDMERSKR
jgi:hypothetical protein